MKLTRPTLIIEQPDFQWRLYALGENDTITGARGETYQGPQLITEIHSGSQEIAINSQRFDDPATWGWFFNLARRARDLTDDQHDELLNLLAVPHDARKHVFYGENHD